MTAAQKASRRRTVAINRAKRAALMRQPLLLAPIDCVVLAVDPPEGWAIFLRGALVAYGAVEPHESEPVFLAALNAIKLALRSRSEIMMCIEKPITTGRFRGNLRGGSRALWSAQFKKACREEGVPSYIWNTPVGHWRAKLFGKVALKGEEFRRHEASIAASLADAPIWDGSMPNTGINAAICIGAVASRSPVVFELIPKTRRRLMPTGGL